MFIERFNTKKYYITSIKRNGGSKLSKHKDVKNDFEKHKYKRKTPLITQPSFVDFAQLIRHNHDPRKKPPPKGIPPVTYWNTHKTGAENHRGPKDDASLLFGENVHNVITPTRNCDNEHCTRAWLFPPQFSMTKLSVESDDCHTTVGNKGNYHTFFFFRTTSLFPPDMGWPVVSAWHSNVFGWYCEKRVAIVRKNTQFRKCRPIRAGYLWSVEYKQNNDFFFRDDPSDALW